MILISRNEDPASGRGGPARGEPDGGKPQNGSPRQACRREGAAERRCPPDVDAPFTGLVKSNVHNYVHTCVRRR